jgi:hypothetical protein
MSRLEDEYPDQSPNTARLLDQIHHSIHEAQKSFYILLMIASLALIALKTDKDAMLLQMFNGCFQLLFLVL